MTTPKFTPGLWRIAIDMRGLGNVPVAGVETPAGLAIANCGTHGDANARLIASAPDLLSVLHKIAVQSWTNADEARECIAYSRELARAAIARATGAA